MAMAWTSVTPKKGRGIDERQSAILTPTNINVLIKRFARLSHLLFFKEFRQLDTV